jgi:hypothetical protein
MILRYLLAWIPMVFIGILNGIVREITYGKFLSELRAHQLSTAIGVCLFGLYIGALMRFLQVTSSAQALTIGLIWLGLTVIFEFTFGHYVAGQAWHKLLSDYNILAGRVWVLLLLWIAIAPWLFYHWQLQHFSK